MDQILGWGTAGGLGVLLAGLGVFFWGLQFVRGYWRQGQWTSEEKYKK
jgi:hypothetical protein